jgi:hypothetical protein
MIGFTLAAGAMHASDIPFWFSNRDGENAVRNLEKLQPVQNIVGAH